MHGVDLPHHDDCRLSTTGFVYHGRPMHRLWLVVSVLVACGGDDDAGHLADAPPPPPVDAAVDAAPIGDPVVDAAPDAPPDAPAPLPVFLRILKNGNPAPEVLVYFQNADNTVVATVRTDDTGIAQAVMDAGGYVTAINPFTTPIEVRGLAGILPPDELRTFAGVKPGDHLVLTHDDDPATFGLSVTVPEISNGTQYEVHSTCGSGDVFPPPPPPPGIRLASASGLVDLTQGCTTADFLVVSHRNNEGDQLVSAFFHPDVTVAGVEGIDFTQPVSDSYTALTTATFSYTNAPDVGSIRATHYLASVRGMFDRTPPFGGTVFLTDGAGSIDVAEPDAQGLIGILDTRVVLTADHHMLQWGPNAPSYESDMAGVLLRDVLSSPSYDIATQQLRWTEATAGATADLTTAEIQVTRQLPDSQTRWNWRIAAPYTTGRLQFPTLPVTTWTPVTGNGVGTARFVNAKVPGGYDLARPRALDVQDRGNVTSFVFGAGGRTVTVGDVVGELQRAASRSTSAPRALRR